LVPGVAALTHCDGITPRRPARAAFVIPFLVDQNFNEHIVDGLTQRNLALNVPFSPGALGLLDSHRLATMSRKAKNNLCPKPLSNSE
jgi:hypothetical protein